MVRLVNACARARTRKRQSYYDSGPISLLAANLGKMDSSVARPVKEEGKVEWIWNEMFQVNDKSINNRVIILMIIIIAVPNIILFGEFEE